MIATPQTLLAEAECYICMGVDTGEAIELALLARIATPVAAPVLSFTFPNLSWTFSGTNPATWSIQESADGVTNWTQVDTASGASRSAQFTDSGVAVRIVGVSPSTPPSNVVVVN